METSDFLPYLVAMGLGLLLGLERERRQEEEIFAGIRTLPLIALLGALIQQYFAYLHLPAFLLVGALIAVSTYGKLITKDQLGMTTGVAALLTYIFGAMCTHSPAGMKWAAIFGVITLTLLTVKSPLHRFANQVDNQEMYTTLKFAVITLVILPLLPNEEMDLLLGLNPRFVWLMVVLVSGLSFGAYFLSFFFGARAGIGITGLLGGFISSTATAMSMSEKSQADDKLSLICSIAVVIASLTMFPRVLVEVLVVNPALLHSLLYPMSTMVVAGLLPILILFSMHTGARGDSEEIHFNNPFQLQQALIFGAFFAGILLLTDYANQMFGERGTYVTAFISGLMDVDAITLSLSEAQGEENVTRTVARNGIIIGAITNTAVKGAISWIFGTYRMGLYVSLSLILSIATGGFWLLFL